MSKENETSLGDAIAFGVLFGLSVSMVGGILAGLTLLALSSAPTVSLDMVAVNFARFFAIWMVIGTTIKYFSDR